MLRYFNIRQQAWDRQKKEKEDDLWGCGPGLSEKVSRRAILDKSLSCPVVVDEEDIWFSTSKLFLDHINEIHSKWEAIEDDIWAKVIVMERNRRVAKAYVRSPTITIGGGPEGFDGLRIGLEGFGNPLRDEETERVKKKIGVQACKIRMEEDGNVLIKRTGKTEVSVLAAADTGDRRQADRLGRNQGHLLETDKTVALFDMNKFQRNMAESMRYGQRHKDRREMELQCVSTVGFVPGQAGQAGQVLDQPCWIIVINMVTLDLLRSSMAHDPVMTLRPAMDIRSRPRLSLPLDVSQPPVKGCGHLPVPKGDSLYYCGLQARIAPFVLAKQRGVVEEPSGSESEYSQIEENIYGQTGYSVRWG